MAKSKYSIIKGKTGKSKKVVVAGKKKVLYRKVGSSSMYVLSKGRHIKLSAYKKSKMKGGNSEQTAGGKRRRRRYGGIGDFLGKITGNNQEGGGKGRRKKKRRVKK